MATLPEALAQARELIERFEGIEPEAYLDAVGVPTICAGLTRYPDGRPVRLGDVCDLRICRGYLEKMLREIYQPQLECIPGWGFLGATRQAVLFSFAWNMGARFYGTDGFETISQVLRDGAETPAAYDAMPRALALYVKAGGRTLAGLVRRRQEEADLWNSERTTMLRFTASQDTLLKKAPIDGAFLSDLGKRVMAKGETLAIRRCDELAGDSHAWFTLDSDGSRWAVYLPHWRPVVDNITPPSPTQAVNWADFSAPVGRFITVGEVLQYDARRRPRSGSPEEKALLAVCREFDAIREAWKGPLGVTSGHRPEPINREVGGVPNSYHVKGMALDIYPVNGSLEQFHRWLLPRWSGGYGDGRPRGFIHIDTRNGGKFHARGGVKPAAVWDY